MASEKTRSKIQKYLDDNLWPMIIIAFLTGTVAFNVAVATIAAKHPPELMTENYYEKGANLRQVVSEKQATERTGWKITADMATEDKMLVMLTVVDGAGLPCDSIVGTCSLYRPSDKYLDQEAKQILSMGAGRYAIKAETPLMRGAWECVADLSRGEKHYKDRISFFVN
jgi:nitrogen fixation protein FixH